MRYKQSLEENLYKKLLTDFSIFLKQMLQNSKEYIVNHSGEIYEKSVIVRMFTPPYRNISVNVLLKLVDDKNALETLYEALLFYRVSNSYPYDYIQDFIIREENNNEC